MRAERGVDQILVVDELLLLGGHVDPVEAEELAVVRRVVDLHLLELRLPLADLAGRLDVEAGRGAERLHQQVLAAVELLARDLGRLEEADDGVEQPPRLRRVVGAVVADVDVEREPLALGPGVDREVRLGEHDAAGEAAALELVEGNAHRRETGSLDHRDALCAEALAVQKELRIAAAAGEVTDEMQTVHFFILQNAKARPAVAASPSIRALRRTQRSSVALNSYKTS